MAFHALSPCRGLGGLINSSGDIVEGTSALVPHEKKPHSVIECRRVVAWGRLTSRIDSRRWLSTRRR
jgi:hypothetical protein